MAKADETRTVALTRVEAEAILDALYAATVRAAMSDQLYGVEREAHRKVRAAWPKRRRSA